MAQRERTPLNAPGPFFTEKDCCISCRAPEAEAPDLMAFDEGAQSCYFRRQPATPEEVARAINAVAVSCCDSVQYDGDDAAVLARLRALRPGQSRAAPLVAVLDRDLTPNEALQLTSAVGRMRLCPDHHLDPAASWREIEGALAAELGRWPERTRTYLGGGYVIFATIAPRKTERLR